MEFEEEWLNYDKKEVYLDSVNNFFRFYFTFLGPRFCLYKMELCCSQLSDKTKKANSLISLLYAKKLDKKRLKEIFLENYASVPQEHRLTFWKLLLGNFYSVFLENISEINYENHDHLRLQNVYKVFLNSSTRLSNTH